MFGKKSAPKRRGIPFPLMILRLLLSLIMLLILGIVVLQAFIYFSGGKVEQDPRAILKQLKSEPQGAIMTLISSQEVLRNISLFANLNNSKGEEQKISSKLKVIPSGTPVLKFALVADSHNDNNNLAKALSMAKERGAKFVIGLGDYTATGTLPELHSAKETFDSSGLTYYLTAGDHDLWESREKKLPAIANFNQVFSSPYQSFIDSNTRFVIVDNSDNYEGVSSLELSWIKDVLENSGSPKTVLFFLHEPLYHPTSDRVMGSVSDEANTGTPKLKNQAKELEDLFTSRGVGAVFAGNIHAYSAYEGKSGLPMYTIGAVTADRNVQLPRFAIVDVYENGSYNVEDLEIK